MIEAMRLAGWVWAIFATSITHAAVRRIRLLSAILKADTRANSKACSEIPYSAEQGIISAEQGILV
jgi:hypothetical protein